MRGPASGAPQKKPASCVLRRPSVAPAIAQGGRDNYHFGRCTLRNARAVLLDIPTGSHARRLPLELSGVTLIEQYASPGSSWSRWQARKRRMDVVGEAQGASIRICLGEELQTLAEKGFALPTDSPPPRLAPSLELGRVVIWHLNFATVSHRVAFLDWLRVVQPAHGTQIIHHPSSPPCGWASSAQHINHAKRIDLRDVRRRGREQLEFTRTCHRIFRKKILPRVSSRRSHTNRPI